MNEIKFSLLMNFKVGEYCCVSYGILIIFIFRCGNRHCELTLRGASASREDSSSGLRWPGKADPRK